MRLALILLVVGACSPDIQSGAYYCGADEACPPDLVCDGTTNLCVAPAEVTAFSCAEGPALFPSGCGAVTLESNGCVMAAAGHDTFTFATDATCSMAFDVMISEPIAFMPLGFTVKDGGGTVVATGAPCHIAHGGNVDVCATFTGGMGAAYTIDVAAADGAPDCDGACAFNRFAVSVQVTRP